MSRLLVVDPSVAYAEDEGIAAVLRDWPGKSVIAQPALRPGDGPAPGTPYDADGVVVLGSRASVHDDLRWLHELGAWLDPILSGAVAIPLLGVCFGHQLMAHRAGGVVEPLADGGRELGLRRTRLSANRLLPDGESLWVVVSHGEEVRRLPDGYRITASRERVRVDGMEHRELPLFGVQFHPEARRGFLETRGIEPDGLDEAEGDGARLIAAFHRIVRDRS